ncbi:MAG: transcriptional repressor [Chloroflexi bacterium]|nr:transcriptional repressor [Chloroflexota bacterium]
MTHNRLNYIEILHAHGYRVTPQRLAVLDALCAAGGHTTSAEVLARARALDARIDRSTVYRSLDVLVKSGLALTAPGDNAGETRYEIVQESPHHHLRCSRCGTEHELSAASAGAFFRQVEREYGYRLTGDHLVLEGVCPECQKHTAGH